MSLKDLAALAMETKAKKFTACVSNPPYQISPEEDSVNNAAVNIFHLFYSVSTAIADVVSMVFPGGRWMQRSAGCGAIADEIFSNVAKVWWYRNGDEPEGRELFETARIRDGVSIVFTDMKAIGKTVYWNGFPISRPVGDEIYPLQKDLTSLALKGIALSEKRANAKYVSRSFFGVYSQFTERNPEKVCPIEQKPPFDAVKAFLANELPGSAKYVKEYWLDKSAVDWTPARTAMLSKWKVIGGQGGVGKDPQRERYRVIDNEHLVGESYIIVGYFDTKEEADNYCAYISSNLGRRLLEASKGGKTRKWGWFLPDLEDYTDSNPDIDWSQPLDPQLYELFGLTEEEIAIVEASA